MAESFIEPAGVEGNQGIRLKDGGKQTRMTTHRTAEEKWWPLLTPVTTSGLSGH